MPNCLPQECCFEIFRGRGGAGLDLGLHCLGPKMGALTAGANFLADPAARQDIQRELWPRGRSFPLRALCLFRFDFDAGRFFCAFHVSLRVLSPRSSRIA
jgi:hypothetical protein